MQANRKVGRISVFMGSPISGGHFRREMQGVKFPFLVWVRRRAALLSQAGKEKLGMETDFLAAKKRKRHKQIKPQRRGLPTTTAVFTGTAVPVSRPAKSAGQIRVMADAPVNNRSRSRPRLRRLHSSNPAIHAFVPPMQGRECDSVRRT